MTCSFMEPARAPTLFKAAVLDKTLSQPSGFDRISFRLKFCWLKLGRVSRCMGWGLLACAMLIGLLIVMSGVAAQTGLLFASRAVITATFAVLYGECKIYCQQQQIH